MPARRADLLFGSPTGVALLKASDLPDNAQICNCNGVSKRQIVDAIQTKGCQSVSKVGACTKAGLGCGSCKSLVAQLLEVVSRAKLATTRPSTTTFPACRSKNRNSSPRSRTAASSPSVRCSHELAGGLEDPASKVGLASLLKTLWPDEYDDERDARFINDRVHANIQKDGTFSVVPRIYAGVTTADELMRIAQVAVKYQRADGQVHRRPADRLAGHQEGRPAGRVERPGHAERPRVHESLPHLQELRGHGLLPLRRRRFDCAGAEDRAPLPGRGVAAQDEARHGRMPAQLLRGLREGPRRGGHRRRAVGDLRRRRRRRQRAQRGPALHRQHRTTRCCSYMGRFIQYYREHGRYLERSYGFLERVGIDNLRKILVEDSLGSARISTRKSRRPWMPTSIRGRRRSEPAYHAQFSGAELAYALEVAENNG